MLCLQVMTSTLQWQGGRQPTSRKIENKIFWELSHFKLATEIMFQVFQADFLFYYLLRDKNSPLQCIVLPGMFRGREGECCGLCWWCGCRWRVRGWGWRRWCRGRRLPWWGWRRLAWWWLLVFISSSGWSHNCSAGGLRMLAGLLYLPASHSILRNTGIWPSHHYHQSNTPLPLHHHSITASQHHNIIIQSQQHNITPSEHHNSQQHITTSPLLLHTVI